ncbi:NAC domain-containing protein 21/22-like [Impatiens glandulifera]|uniref:NAC domain-containing protein 21/22-like n=1 Tax=Impatiens glandulifera TaxID=253017 RepID=UPI001FB12013|nr:NAC domain-containing protein 21/22-like [Impatiens glandulifera]
MGLRDIGASLPPGFRFYPSDEELVCHYLFKKIANEDVLKGTLVEIDLHTCEPWQLPDVAKLNANEWYFFSFRDRKYSTGYRTNRATTCGYWKATGKDRVVHDPRTKGMVGMRKTLVFYQNRAPNGIKTGWIMHEFRLETPHMPPKEDWVLCRVFHKSKGESSNNNDDNQPNMFETSVGATSSTLDSSIFNLDFPTPPHHRLNQRFLNLPEANPSFPHLSHDLMSNVGICQTTSRRDHDDYGFLFDVNFGEGIVPQNLGEIRFDNGNIDSSSMVFL